MEKTQIALDTEDVRDWLESLNDVMARNGASEAQRLLQMLQVHAQVAGVTMPFSANTSYVNTIALENEPRYPGDRELERRIKSIIRWNATAMVVRANREEDGIGGHISTYQSAATLYEVAFNHFFRGRTEKHPGDMVFFQGHASPGIYARAYLEGRLQNEDLKNFRHELHDKPGLSSYPHPWLMPSFWQFPTVSMGLGPIMAIYQARFVRFLEDRGLKPKSDQKVWAFLGDGETDEPESLGALTLASREGLDNLIFVVNCNLQRLDGPVRGNGKIIQELEAAFRGAGWNVIKVVWGEGWDKLFAADKNGKLVQRLMEIVDGEYQKFTVENGAYMREKLFGKDPELLELVKNLSDSDLENLRRGGHDPQKVYAAYKAATEHKGAPTVILAKTVKGYGMGTGGEGRNVTHQQKKLSEQELRNFRSRFSIPLSDEDIADLPFYRPGSDSPEMKYLMAQREKLGGSIPKRFEVWERFQSPAADLAAEFVSGSEREVSTTMAFVKMLGKMLKDEQIGKYIVPIVPDEARTFGMDPLFRQVGIYAHAGQKYEPVDSASLLYYREAKDGQILEEGINEAGAMSSFIAAGTSYANHSVPMVPFYIYYSMFGLQRVGDLIYAAADMRCKGFLIGGTSGRTTLAGEGLQHQDGHSHVQALAVPSLVAYDPAFAFELAVIIREGLRRMYELGENIFYYITVMNENYAQPPMPHGADEGILRGIYKFRSSSQTGKKTEAQLLGSGAILNEVLKAQKILANDYGVETDVWSVTSYKQMLRDANDVERWNMMHPTEKQKEPYLAQAMKGAKGPIIAASDYLKTLPFSVAKWLPGNLTALGTDGFGRSDGRDSLRDFFEVDAKHIVFATISALAREGKKSEADVAKARVELGIQTDRPNPLFS
jgi:pyruvate dehydrogenase E1 component